MIKAIKAYQVSDGSTAATLEEAQTKELELLMAASEYMPYEGEKLELPDVAKMVVAERDKVLDILTTGPNSRPARRKVNGAKPLKRGRKTAEQMQQGELAAERLRQVGEAAAA